MHLLPTGRALIDPFKTLEEAGIRQGMRVADFGVGTVGHFLFPAAELVGEKGHVYGIDILKPVLQAARSRARLAGAGNVELIWGNLEKLGGSRLPDNSMDLALIVNLLHAVKNSDMLKEARRILGTDGLLLVVDWKPAGSTLGPKAEHRLPKEEAKALASAAGFALDKDYEAGAHHYALLFKKAG